MSPDRVPSGKHLPISCTRGDTENDNKPWTPAVASTNAINPNADRART